MDKLKKISLEIFKVTEELQGKFGLNLDQLGELDAEIMDIFEGFSKSDDFVKNISRRLEIDSETANKVAEEVNKKIFEVYKEHMKTEAAMADKAISSVEKAGGFEIERETVKPMSDEDALNDRTPSGLPDRVNLMDKTEETHKDPLEEQLLNQSPISAEETKETTGTKEASDATDSGEAKDVSDINTPVKPKVTSETKTDSPDSAPHTIADLYKEPLK